MIEGIRLQNKTGHRHGHKYTTVTFEKYSKTKFVIWHVYFVLKTALPMAVSAVSAINCTKLSKGFKKTATDFIPTKRPKE